MVTSSWGIAARTFQEYHECTVPRFNLNTVSAEIEIPYSDMIFFILRRYVEVYPNICPILMGCSVFLYFNGTL